MPSSIRPVFPIVATLAVFSLACSNGTGPVGTGRTRQFRVSSAVIDESSRAGYGDCHTSSFTMVVDSGANGLSALTPAVSLVCDVGAGGLDTTLFGLFSGFPNVDPAGHDGQYGVSLSDPNNPVVLEFWWDSLSAPLAGEARHFMLNAYDLRSTFTAQRK